MSLYNEARFVEEAVASILHQTFRDFELLVVDDGSTDGGADVVARIADPRIRLIRQPNQGLAGALNTGIRAARAEWIARHDADDVSEPRRLEAQYDAVTGRPELVLLGTNALMMDEEGQPLTTTTHPTDDPSIRTILFDRNLGNPFIHGSVMMRRSALLEAGLYRLEFRQAQDYDLWQRMAPFGVFANLPEPLYRWRLRRGGAGLSRGETQRDYGRLALLCTDHRVAGKPEPPLDLALVQRRKVRSFFGALRRVEGEQAYEFSLAKFRLRAGERRRARAHAFSVVKSNPINVYAWLLVALSFLPASSAQRVWQRATTLYRRLIWRRKRSGL
jgi:glycosyltransferase involved in cell wall biosynthesis